MATNIGTGPQDIPLNQFLGEQAFLDKPSKVPAFVAGPEKMGPASFFTGNKDNFEKDFAVDFTKQFKPLYKGTTSGN